jgi:hypothetical protein
MSSKLHCKHERVEFVVYRIGTNRWIDSTCMDCGTQWQTSEVVEDLAEPISSNELIEVHEQLDSQALADLFSKEET